MAGKPTKKGIKSTKVKKDYCPMRDAKCVRVTCMWFNRAKDKKYSRCAVLDLAQNLNNLSFRVGEIAKGGEDSDLVEDAEE